MKSFHNTISWIFHPLLLPFYGFVLLVNTGIFTLYPVRWKIVAVIGTFLFTNLLPSISIFWLIRKGEIQDVFISRRKERTIPYLFAIMAYLFWIVFQWRTLHMYSIILSMSIGSTLSVIAIMLINLRWKISAHAAGIAGLTAAIFCISFRMAINPVALMGSMFVVSGLVALARLELKAHTATQLLTGYILGFLFVFIPGLVF